MNQIKLAFSWIKKNTLTVLLILLVVLALFIVVLFGWLKIRGFKIVDLMSALALANAKNELSHLETKKAVLETKTDAKQEEIQAVEQAIKEERKKLETARLEVKGKTNEEIAKSLTDLGF